MSSTHDKATKGNLDTSTSLLPHLSFNESGETTIVLPHGLSGSPKAYENIHPHLTAPSNSSSASYHILAPYLPGHGLASTFEPFSLPYAASMVATLIESKAKEGKAHVVGLSCGGFVAVNVAKTYSAIVLSLFAAGVGGLAGSAGFIGSNPYVIRAALGFQYSLPESAYQWVQRQQGMQIPDGLREEMWANAKIVTLKAAIVSIGKDGGAKPLTTRSLIVAGGAGDSKEGTTEYAKEVRKGNELSRAAVVPNAMHAWDLQFPEVFAKGVRAWVEQTDLPPEYETISLD